jgi:hypothetical protein
MLDTSESVANVKTRVDITPLLSNEGFRENDNDKNYSEI